MMARLGIGCLWLLRFLPLALLARVGTAFGRVLWWLAAERRRVCRINLERCLPDLTADQCERIARAHFAVLGRSLLERGLAAWAPRGRLARMVRIDGLERLRGLEGHPVILLAPHFVGLDIGFTRLAMETDLASMYAMQKSAAVNALLMRGRTRFGHQRMFSRQEGVRSAIAALREGLPFYYLPDMDYGPRDAIFVPFFGVPAATITGLSRIAKLTGAAVVPCITRMLPGGAGYVLSLHSVWEDFPGADPENDTRRMNAFIEAQVRDMPEQYFWTHKRFKTRPEGEARWY